MPQSQSRVSQLVRWNARKSDRYVQAMTLEVSREAQARVGKVHALIAAEAPAKTGEALFAHLEDAFGRGVAEAIRRLPPDAGQEQVFEAAVASVNHAVSRVLGEHGLQLEPEYVTAALISVKDHDVVAATWGRPYILLFHPLPGDTGRCKVFDLVEDNGAEEQQPYRVTPVRRCFGSVISGRIGKRDRVLLSTENLAAIPGMEPLEEFIMADDPETATDLIQERLAPIKEDLPLAMMVLDVTQVRYVEQVKDARPTAEERPGSTHASLAKLRKTASHTNEIMSPSPLSHLAKKGFVAFGGLAENLKKMATETSAAMQEKLKEMHESRKEALEAKLQEKSVATESAPTAEKTPSVAETEPAAKETVALTSLLPEGVTPADKIEETASASVRSATEETLLDILPPEAKETFDAVATENNSAAATRADAAEAVIAEVAVAETSALSAQGDAEEFPEMLVTADLLEGVAIDETPAMPTVAHETDSGELPSIFVLTASNEAEKRREALMDTEVFSVTPAADDGKTTTRQRFSLRKKVDAVLNKSVDGFNALAPKSRYTLFIALTLAMAFNDSILVGSWQRKIEEIGSAEEKRISSIEMKIDAAEASMIYRDENRAKTLLAEATAAIETLPEKKPQDAEKKAELKSRIAASRDTLRRVVPLAAPEVIATIAADGKRVALAKIAMRGDSAWTVSTDGELYKITLKDGAATKVDSVPGGAPKALIAAGDGILAVADGGVGRFVSPSGKATDRTVQADADVNINDADIYGSRLYVLDAAHNRIVRHAAEGSGYGKAQSYMKDGTDLSNAVSLAIDSVVYVLNADGSVVRIAKGSHEDFAVAQADPPVTAAKRIRTHADAKHLYVLDGSPARILKFGKDSGFLVAQYVSPSLEGATDFAVDEKAKTATVAVGDKLLKFGLPE